MKMGDCDSSQPSSTTRFNKYNNQGPGSLVWTFGCRSRPFHFDSITQYFEQMKRFPILQTAYSGSVTERIYFNTYGVSGALTLHPILHTNT